jgi:small subunit ribosomal protein S6
LAVTLYEGMFVVDVSRGGSEFTEVVRHIADILTRHGAQIERLEKWDERKLSYPIGKAKRGIYVLTYFRVDGSAIAEIRHSVRLSEQVLRALFIKPEAVSPVQGQLYDAEGNEVEAPPAEPVAHAVLAGREDEDEDEDDDEDEGEDEEQ